MIVDVVIVTYNRLDKLKKALRCYEEQTQPFRNLIVVNNHSTDGTENYLEEWKMEPSGFSKYVITTNENLGGSGGFYEGQKFAMTLNPDWIFLADDDAYVEPALIQKFDEFSKNNDIDCYSAVCSMVLYNDNTINYKHRSRIIVRNHRFFTRVDSLQSDYGCSMFSIDLLSYVGSFINAKAIGQVGLVNPDYFIYYDDSEHSLRLRKYGLIVCVPSIKVVHDESPESGEEITTWRDYYLARNEMHMMKRHYFLAALHRTRIFFKQNKFRGGAMLVQIRREAIIDAWLGNLGVHPNYKPGWKA